MEKKIGLDFNDIILYLSGIKIRSQPCIRICSTTNTLGVIIRKVAFLGNFGKRTRKTHFFGIFSKSIGRRAKPNTWLLSYLYSGEIEYDITEIRAELFFTFGPKWPIFSGPVHTQIMVEKFRKKITIVFGHSRTL